MESVASREQKEILRRQSLQRQIAQLQAQLSDPNAPCPSGHDSRVEDGKRKHSNGTVLAPASPDRSKRPVLCRYEQITHHVQRGASLPCHPRSNLGVPKIIGT
jgi:hypothetical protein